MGPTDPPFPRAASVPLVGPALDRLLRGALLYRAMLVPALALSLLPNLANFAAAVVLGPEIPRGVAPEEAALWILLVAFVTLVWLLALGWVAAVLAKAGNELLLGRALEFQSAIEATARRLGAVLRGVFRWIVLVVTGLVLLVFPGLLFLAGGLLVVHVVLLEWRSPKEALARSRDLMKGHRIVTLAALLAVLVPWALLAWLALLFLPAVHPWADDAAVSLLATAAFPLVVAVLTVTYREALGWTPAVPEPAPAAGAPPVPPSPEPVRYTCPRCRKVYRLPLAPAPGTPCPACRRRG